MTNENQKAEWEAEIDGSTLEQRRDQRAEQLEKFLGSLSEEDRAGFIGKVNQWMQATGVQVVDASQSVYDLDKKQKQLRDFGETHVFEDLPPVVRRSPDQRVAAMARRLRTMFENPNATVVDPETGQTITHQQVIEATLNEIKEAYWEAGMPVTDDQLRVVAAHYLNRSERRK